VASDDSYSYAQTGAVNVAWVVVAVGIDCGERFRDGRGGRGEAGWSASHPRMTAELNVGGGVFGHQMLLESQPGEVLGMRSESGE